MNLMTSLSSAGRAEAFRKKMISVRRSWQLYVFLLLPVAYIIIFKYIPMYGLQIAFKNYDPFTGFLRSQWVGLYHFKRFVTSYYFWTVFRNTLTLSLYSLAAGLPAPIILAIALNECTRTWFKKTVQTVTYAPHFISMVVMVSIITMGLSINNGVINNFIALLGGKRIQFMGIPQYFQTIYVFSGIWQGMGYSSIIYLAALTAIDPTLYEAARIDGATRIHKIIHIDLPGIMPTIVILLIMAFGSIISVGFEKAYLMQNNQNLQTSEIISTYVYKQGIERANFSYSTAVGFFNSVINFVMLLTVNRIARSVGESSLW
jgi:putative aldouronate transport system permease protein